MMKISTWNITELNVASKHTKIRKVFFDYHLSLSCIVETKALLYNVARAKSLCIPNWGLIHNNPTNDVGYIWIMWDPEVFDMQVLKLNTQYVNCLVTVRSTQKVFAVIGVYGFNTREERWDLWMDLRKSNSAMGQ